VLETGLACALGTRPARLWRLQLAAHAHAGLV